ncbi:AraC family transcriptional regulator [Paenibacillus sp. XY044]|uniref:AraC family ligand binding domain-containing protein n=1 Tax=Paenibacillus sp. XY044 TaxID=2026089 RepID=UPI000B97E0B7|nr:AraC family transcriptional regulator [Paenibacillus sp. XY044]OZB98631.1 AraC family transcriptional regulator [Paenibacillus sp. XY044]
MPDEIRTVYYDAGLQVEAYRFVGVKQKFPPHFHDYYVIGFIEGGQRYLACRQQEYIIHPGDIIIFNPRDVHTCEQVDGRALDYRCINIQPERMMEIVQEITGRSDLPVFTQTVLCQSEFAPSLQELHAMICEGEPDFIKEERFFLLMGQLFQEYSDTPADGFYEVGVGFQDVCDYMEANFAGAVSLDELSALAGLSKYHFLRSFTRERGISPYSYLETVRIGHAKKLLEQGVPPADTALQTGFSDQSHFSNFFKRFIGLTPRQYMRIFIDERQVERIPPVKGVKGV